MRSPAQRPPSRRLVLAACLYATLAIVVQRPLVRAGLGDHVPQQNMLGQDCLLHAWAIAWGQHALATAPCAVAEANIFHPERRTLFYSDHLLGLAILTAPLRLVTTNALLVHNVLVVAAPALDALALYVLAFGLTGSVAASLVGGLVYGFAPLRFAADACQIQMTAAWWAPLALHAGRRAVRGDGRRFGVVAGLALLGQGLSGIYLTAFFAPFLAFAHAWWWRRHPFRQTREGWTALLASESAAVLLLVPMALAYRAVQEHLNTARSPFLNAILSLQWSMLPEHVPVLTVGALMLLSLVRPFDLPRALREERGLFLVILAGGLLLALGPAIPLPNDLGTVAGPYRLLLDLPGYTALRVPARMLHVALLGASVLAAGGVAVLREVAWRASTAVTVAVTVALWLEQPPVAFGVVPVPRPARIDAVYTWLATAPGTGVVVELPVDPMHLATAVRQYASTAHWREMLNGVSGIEPTMYPYVAHRLADFPAPDVVDDVAALGVRTAIVHTLALPASTREALSAAERARRVLKPRWRHGPTVVFALRPPRPPRAAPRLGRRLDTSQWHATATAASNFAARAIDGDPTTAWRSWADLDASVENGWYHPLPILERWKRSIAGSPVSLTIDLGRGDEVSAIQLLVGGSDPMMLPELVLEVSDDAASWTRLPVHAFPDVRALVTRAAEAPLAARLDAPRRIRFVRITVGAYDSAVRDVALFAR